MTCNELWREKAAYVLQGENKTADIIVNRYSSPLVVLKFGILKFDMKSFFMLKTKEFSSFCFENG